MANASANPMKSNPPSAKTKAKAAERESHDTKRSVSSLFSIPLSWANRVIMPLPFSEGLNMGKPNEWV